MAFDNTSIALALLETIVLLLPFIALIFQAIVPDKGWIQVEETRILDIRDPRNVIIMISMILVLALALVLTYFTANFRSELSPYLYAAIMMVSLASALMLYLVYRLVELRRDLTKERGRNW